MNSNGKRSRRISNNKIVLRMIAPLKKSKLRMSKKANQRTFLRTNLKASLKARVQRVPMKVTHRAKANPILLHLPQSLRKKVKIKVLIQILINLEMC